MYDLCVIYEYHLISPPPQKKRITTNQKCKAKTSVTVNAMDICVFTLMMSLQILQWNF
jgi:hypothetical protein